MITLLLVVGTSLLDKKGDPVGRNQIPGHYPGQPQPYPYAPESRDLPRSGFRQWNSNWEFEKRFAGPGGGYEDVVNALASVPPEVIRQIRCHVNPGRVANAKGLLPELASDPFPAEISTLFLTLEDSERCPPESKLRVGFLASDTEEGVYCARAARFLAARLFPGRCTWVHDGDDETKSFREGVHRVAGLDANRPQEVVEQALPALARIVQDQRAAAADDRLILDVTGGFKVLLPYLGVLGTLFDGVEVQSLFESSAAHVRLPPLPVGLDSVLWAENRSSLNATLAAVRSADTENARTFREALPPRLKTLWRTTAAGPLEPHPLVEVLSARAGQLLDRNSIARYHHPAFVANLFQDRSLATVLLDWVERAGDLWFGDFIPEAVDHGRGHAQRLWEMAHQVLWPIEQAKPGHVTDEEKVLLLATLWVHDVGHATHSMQLGVPSWDGAAPDQRSFAERPFSLFPSLIRDLHSFTADQRLRSDPSFQFPTQELLGLPFKDAVALSYRYHRGKLPLAACTPPHFFARLGDKDQRCWGWVRDVEKGVGDMSWGWPTKGASESAVFITALQRVIDGADVQAERAGDPGYRDRRERLTRDEIRIEFDRLVRLRQFVSGSAWTDPHGKGPLSVFWNDLLRLQSGSEDGAVVHADGAWWHLGRPDSQTGAALARVEQAIYEALDALWQRSSRSAADEVFFEYLGTIDRIAFKFVQPLHFAKHAGIRSSAIRRVPQAGGIEFEFEFVIECEAGRQAVEGATKVAKDMLEEVDEDVLAHRSISFPRARIRPAGAPEIEISKHDARQP